MGEARTEQEGDPAEATPRERRVLLVEDEELVAMVMVDELRQLGWTVVGPASTLEEAQILVSSGVPLDAAVLDINLRGRWVHGLAEDLKARGVPFVVCTGYEMVDPDGRFADAPLIAKPLVGARLGATLEQLVGQVGPPNAPIEPGAG